MSKDDTITAVADVPGDDPGAIPPAGEQPAQAATKEIGGPKGPEPTRYGDWEVKGRCIDF